MDHNVDGYSKEKGCEYIDKKLKGAGCQQDVFEDREAIINASAEMVHIISKLCRASLMISNSLGRRMS